jgi:rare lipoprotein A
MRKTGVVAVLSIVSLLSGCASQEAVTASASRSIQTGEALPGSRYAMIKDTGPEMDVDVSDVLEPKPQYETILVSGNKSPYTVLGKSYRVMSSADNYIERGVGSWYGKKFHGHLTSNGEIFDMYKVSAAHKSLPIPSYAKVTNINNGKSIIVRVNDRGPFHEDRIIDLSYAAAKKLGYQSVGVAELEVAAITVKRDGSYKTAKKYGEPFKEKKKDWQPRKGEELFVQVGAFKNPMSAQRSYQELREKTKTPIRVHHTPGMTGGFYRVQVGPMASRKDARSIQTWLGEKGFSDSIILMD